MEDLCAQLANHDDRNNLDTWSYIYGGNENFSYVKAYKALIGFSSAPPHFKWIWESSCQPKHKVFFWLLLHDRLNTRNLLARFFFILQPYNCATLNFPMEETLHHLFWSCPFAEYCWDFICPQRGRNLSVLEGFEDLKHKLNVPFYMEIIILAA